MNRWNKWLAAIGLALLGTAGAWAQGYPNRPIRLIVPFPPGGGSDYMARVVQVQFAEQLKQPVVIDNRGGAGGTLGTDIAAKAAPDGYTLVVGSVATHAIAQALYPKLAYEPLKDFVPVAPIGSMPHILVVHPSLGVSSAKELIALAKAHPGEAAYASAGNGSLGHLTVELFKSMAGLDMRHIPYKGSGPALADLAGGQVKIMFDTLPTGLPLVKSGVLRGLAVSGSKRAGAAPDIPTLAEAGVPGFEVQGWYGIFAPVGTPPDIVRKLNAAMTAVTAIPEVRKQMQTGGSEPTSATPDAYAAYVRAEAGKWAKVVRDSGARVE
ncbi:MULTISPECIES: tripartite tricarboxylate transporter substrate binding protein [unclassified Variovorax]|uniref:Bug family tripartite tricarboxylate transporter substrate binding protein n=1 Tax=unclassified Variovorax TaxID=663243 RepID=UPI0008BD8797|nr:MULTISPECIES: tripartite tricarboxylate transporter substrate binding protein [unclassified Variovorax]SEK16144.1 Tripartite-type tricarboxylate transporter, receptor component TctC [Variovorax sp. OK202]SFE35082.1 Tripartite-type tricarboxylate transporter, receptor component TctC [Variovorax sp. OK212]